MGLTAFVDQVKTALQNAQVTVPHYVGAKHVREHKETSCIVWVSRGGPGEPAKRTQAHPDAIATRRLTVEAYLFASDFAACETLLAQVATVIRGLAMGFQRYLGEGMPLADAANMANGECVVAKFELQFPLDAFTPTTVTVTSAELQAVQVASDGTESTVVDVQITPS